MFIYQILIIISLLTTYGVLIFLFCRIFTKKPNLPLMLIIPVMIFSFGFILRLSEQKSMIDVGYFLTDSSSIFLYALFTGALILGQIKFWKK
jgi:hypothetical protein